MESYIVRIYRREEDDPQGLIGLVEIIGLEEKKAFHNWDELRAILSKTKDETENKKERR